MEYLSAKEAAAKWGVSTIYVQRLCMNGRIEGAAKISGIWAIPADAEKPSDMRKASVKKSNEKSREEKPKQTAEPAPTQNTDTAQTLRTVMPLMNTPYVPGHAYEAANAFTDKDEHNIALGEYYYFSGQSEKASDIVEEYLTSSDIAVRLSACLLYAYANLALDRIPRARQAMTQIIATAKNADAVTVPQYKSYAVCMATAAGMLLHLPIPENSVPIKRILNTLPTGIRLFALYIEAHEAYLNKRYDACIAVAETALALEEKLYPIPSIYLHLVAVMGYINIRETEQTKEHLLSAWQIAEPDDMIEAFGEHHGLLGGMLESVMKKEYPDAFKRIIKITYSFSAGWRKVHNPNTGHYVADDLSTTEFTVAMLVARGWGNKEIADHLHVSTRTVEAQITSVMQKLGNPKRSELSQFLLK